MASNNNRNGRTFAQKTIDETGKENASFAENDVPEIVKLRHKKKYDVGLASLDNVDSTRGRKSMAVSRHLRSSMFVLRDIILLKPEKFSSYKINGGNQSKKQKFMVDDSMDSNGNLTSEENTYCSSNGSLFALRILFVDLLIVCCDLVSSLLQGYALLSTEGKRVFGLITFGINWIPGFVAAIHLLSVYRLELPWYRAIFFAILLIIFYPLVPIIALLIVLWMKPENNKMTKDFREAEYGATVSYAIRGCFESPIQICYQLWLAINGVILMSWNNVISLSLKDWEGNELLISFTAPVCIFFSMLRYVL